MFRTTLLLLSWVLLALPLAAQERVLFIRGGDGTGGFLGGGSDNHLSDIFDVGQAPGNHGYGELRQLLIGEGFLVDQVVEGPVTNNTKIDFSTVSLAAYDVVVFGSNNADYNTQDAEVIRTYICAGGAALFISDANWGQDWGDAPTSDQTFLVPFDLIMNQDAGVYSVSRASGDFVIGGQDMGTHPILAGPDGLVGTLDDVNDFDGEGVSPLSIVNLLPGVTPQVLAKAKGSIHNNDAPGSGSFQPAGADDGSLVVVHYGSGRVAGHFDRNTFFNLNGTGTNLHQLDNTQYAKNLFRWLADAPGGSFGVSCPGSGGFAPSLSLTGCSRPGESVTLALDDALGGATALLVFGAEPGLATLPGGCPLYATPLLPIFLPVPLSGIGPGNGGFSVPLLVPAQASAGAIVLQGLIADPQAPGGVSATGGLSIGTF